MKYIFVVCFVIFTMAFHAQTITVVDKTSRESIAGAIIQNITKNTAGITNAKGKAVLENLSQGDSLKVTYFGYREKNYVFTGELSPKIELLEQNIKLDEIIISASRWENHEKENAVRVEKIKMKDVALQNPQTTADMLGGNTNVYIQKSQQAGGSPILRGFATNRVLLVVDGVRMNNAIFRSGNVQNVISLDANAMESAEVLFGPGAVLYGSDAIGGVMDFHTLKPLLSDSSKPLIKANALMRYSTANQEKTGHADFSIGFKKLGFVSSVTYTKFDDLMAGTIGGESAYLRPYYQIVKANKDTQVVNKNPSLQVNSGYSQLNLMQKIMFAPNAKLKLTYAFHYSESSNAPRYDRLIADANNNKKLDFSEWYYGPQTWQMHHLNIRHKGKGVLYHNMKIHAAYQQFGESRHDRRFNANGNSTSSSARLRHQYEKLNAYSLNADFDKLIGENTELFYGLEYVHNQIFSEAERVNVYTGAKQKINPRYPDGSVWQSAGTYMNIKHKLNHSFILHGGIRYSHYFIQAKFDTALFAYPLTEAKINNGALNGSAGLVYSIRNNWQLYANASTGFRSPNLDDIGKVFDSQPGVVVVPNPGLKPEYAYSGEAGTAVVAGNRLKIDFSGYYTYLQNALVRRPFQFNGNDSIQYEGVNSRVFALQNASHAYVFGFQSGLEIYLGKGFSLKNNITWQSGRDRSLDSNAYYTLSHLIPLYGNARLVYSAKKIKADVYVNYTGEIAYNNMPLSERLEPYLYARDSKGLPYVPAWYTLNAKLMYFVNAHVSLSAGIENITDKLYRPFASGISAPGRNFIIALRMKV